jgi:hypothetical protein
MDSKSQFSVFCFCIAVGFVGGVLYEIFAFCRLIFGCHRGKNRILGGVVDVLFFICLAIFCVISSFLLHFSGFRAYMWLGFALGGIGYAKTLRRILAFLENMCYNVIYKMVIKAKSKKKLSKLGDKDI